MTFEEAENAHNDINQWRTTRDSGSTDCKALWQTPASENRTERVRRACLRMGTFYFRSGRCVIFIKIYTEQ